MWTLRSCFAVNPWGLAALSALAVASSLMPLASLFLLGGILTQLPDLFNTGSDGFALVLPWVIALGVTYILSNLLRALYGYIMRQINEQLSLELEWHLLNQIGNEELIRFEEPEFHNQVQRTLAPTNRRLILLIDRLLQMVRLSTWLVSLAIFLASVHWLPAVILLLSYPVLVWVRYGEAQQVDVVYQQQTPARRRMEYFRQLLSELPGAKELRLFGLGDYFGNQWEKHFSANYGELARVSNDAYRRSLLTQLGVQVGFVVAMSLLAYFTLEGLMMPGMFLAVLMRTPRLHDDIMGIALLIRDTIDLLNKTSYPASYLQEHAGPPAANNVTPFPNPLLHGIRFHRVSFTYPGGKTAALSDVTFHLRPGETVALVGANGSGKSTLARLMLGLYEPQAGQILADGIPYAQISRDSLRESMAVVFQNYVNYHMTLRDAVGFGKIDRLDDDGRLTNALRDVGLNITSEDFPLGLDTQLGRQFGVGMELSGGQWQRIAVARAMYRDAAVLILDEPTASLDPLAEMQALEHLMKMTRGRTTLLISHRLGSARLADRILVLHEGRLVEEGTHQALLLHGGVYAEMFQTQAKWYEGARMNA